MEQVALNNVQLDYLARDDPQLKPYFYGTVACDRLPKTPQGYIVNTDQPGQHWPCGSIGTCVKSWIVMRCRWKDTSKLPR